MGLHSTMNEFFIMARLALALGKCLGQPNFLTFEETTSWVWSRYLYQLAARQMSTRSDGCGWSLVTNDGQKNTRTCGCPVSEDACEQVSRMLAAGIAVKWSADNRRTAGILVSAASRLISAREGILSQQTPAYSERASAVDIFRHILWSQLIQIQWPHPF